MDPSEPFPEGIDAKISGVKLATLPGDHGELSVQGMLSGMEDYEVPF